MKKVRYHRKLCPAMLALALIAALLAGGSPAGVRAAEVLHAGSAADQAQQADGAANLTQQADSAANLTLQADSGAESGAMTALSGADGTPLVLNSADNSAEMAARTNMVGRLYVPSLDINVAMFNVTNETLAVKQDCIDAEDSASYILHKNGTLPLVGDHADTEYGNLQYAVVSETMAYVQSGAQVEAYVCAYLGMAVRSADRRYFYDTVTGESIYDMDYGCEKSFISFTCANEEGSVVYYVVWTPYACAVTAA